MRNPLRAWTLFAAIAAAWSSTAAAATFGFYSITNNSLIDAGIGEAQFFVDVTNGNQSATFTFRNEGPLPAVITEIYFDDGSLLGIASIFDNPPSVDYVQGANPPDLPGANNISPPFQVTAGFLAEPVMPPFHSGVGPGEQVAIVFDLVNGGTLQDVIDEIVDGTLRIGIRGQGFDGGGSEAFVNVPEPSGLALLAIGITTIIARRQRS